MSDEKKYVTFRDLRSAQKSQTSEVSEPDSTDTSTPSLPSIASNTRISSIPRTTSIPSTSKTKLKSNSKLIRPIAPERDFQRVPNSVTRHALPEGLFKGKSKQVWDYIWSVTRGAIIPVRSVHKSRREIKMGSGIGSMVTIDAALDHLQQVGLLKINPSIGSLTGNEYEIFAPEEIDTTYTSISSTPSITSLTQKVDDLDIPKSGISSTTQPVDSTAIYSSPKTSFNTNTEKTDDEAFAKFNETMKKAAKKITGKETSVSESDRWNELAELLAAEAQIAAARTSSVSSVPAFLTEHLRRRLWKLDKKPPGVEVKSIADETSSALTAEQIKNCPDCAGTNFYYPNGFEGGVSKCKHEKLQE